MTQQLEYLQSEDLQASCIQLTLELQLVTLLVHAQTGYSGEYHASTSLPFSTYLKNGDGIV